MTGLKELLDEAAQRARVYPVVEPARVLAHRRRRLYRLFATGASVVAVLAAGTAAGISIAAGWSGSGDAPVGASTGTATFEPSPSARPSVSAWPPLPASCTGQVLPLPAGYSSFGIVTGGDPTGRFLVGRAYPPTGGSTTVIWDREVVAAVPMDGRDATLYDINSSGVAVGSSWLSDDLEAAFIYQEGQMRRLPGENARALSINESGVVLGEIRNAEGMSRSVVWRTPTSQAEPLTVEGYYFGGTEIRNDGAVLGQISAAQSPGFFWGDTTPAVWHADGTIVPMRWPQLQGQDGAVPEYVMMFAAAGDWMLVRTEGETWLRVYGWNIATGELRAFDGDPRVVNARGWVVFQTEQGLALSSVTESLLLPLPSGVTPSPLGPGISFGDPASVSDDGGTIAAGEFVWHCS